METNIYNKVICVIPTQVNLLFYFWLSVFFVDLDTPFPRKKNKLTSYTYLHGFDSKYYWRFRYYPL